MKPTQSEIDIRFGRTESRKFQSDIEEYGLLLVSNEALSTTEAFS